MKTIHTFDIELWTEPEEKERARRLGLDTTHGVFHALKAHLEKTGLLPEYFFEPWEKNPAPMPYFDYARCNVDFSEPEGVCMSIELVTLVDQQWSGQTFAIAGIHGSSADDYLRMCRIAAECSLMFNGRGQEMEREVSDITLTDEENQVLWDALETVFDSPEQNDRERLKTAMRLQDRLALAMETGGELQPTLAAPEKAEV